MTAAIIDRSAFFALRRVECDMTRLIGSIRRAEALCDEFERLCDRFTKPALARSAINLDGDISPYLDTAALRSPEPRGGRTARGLDTLPASSPHPLCAVCGEPIEGPPSVLVYETHTHLRCYAMGR